MSLSQMMRGRCEVLTGSVLACMLMAALTAQCYAADLNIPIEDLTARWDNTLRYNYTYRIQHQDSAILKSQNYDDGDRNFRPGSAGNRVDVLSQFEMVYNDTWGVRVSGAGWYDYAYRNLDGDSPATSNHVVNGTPTVGLSHYAQRYFKGPSGELLDALVSLNFNAAGVPVSIKAGQFQTIWGESILTPIHGVNYGQASLDLGKALSVPGTELQELFRPRKSLFVQSQLLQSLSVSAQYFLGWEPMHIPEAGTFLGFYDFLMQGGETLYAGPGQRLARAPDITPNKHGDWGTALRWSPDFLDGTVGLYYRKTADTLPQVHVSPGVVVLASSVCANQLHATPLSPSICYVNPSVASVQQILSGQIGTYTEVFPGNIDIYGLSLSKNIAGVSVGAELSYRHNTPLLSGPVTVLPGALTALSAGSVSSLPSPGQTDGARGNTAHAVLNAVGIINKTPVFDLATYTVEAVWSRWLQATQGRAVFNGRPGYTGIDHVTSDMYAVAANFTPTWYNVLPSVNLLLPMNFSMGVKGNSAILLGGNQGTGSFSAGLGADIYQRFRVDLKYNGYFGEIKTNSAGQITSQAGAIALIRDRGNATLTFKTTF